MSTNQADSVPPRVLTKSCPTCGTGYAGDLSVCPADGTVLTPIQQDILIGSTIAGRYQILSFIGRGGMSVVYKARHLYMERIAAIKMLHAHLVSNPQSVKRFQQEAQAASCLAHPNIMGVHDFGITPQGQTYLVMDYLQGISLAELIEKEKQIAPERAHSIFVQACDALAHAHQKGVIHRDLKPSNIMLLDNEDQPDFVKIVDFGIAKLLPQSEKQGQHLTQTGEVFGSPLYMSPEQCLAGSLDARSDIYSLGCLMYEALTGKAPLAGANMLETMYMHLNEPPLPFKKVRPDLNLPEELEAVVFKTMEKDPNDRQQSMSELADEIEAVRAAGKGRRPFLGKLGQSVIRKRKGPKVKLSRKQIALISVAALVSGAFLTWALFGFGNPPAGSSAYGPDPFWISYVEEREAPLGQVQASQAEMLLKGLKMLKEKSYGTSDPRVVSIYYRLARLYRRQDRVAEALEYYKKTYDGIRSEIEPNTGNIFNDVSKGLIEMYRLQGDYQLAEDIAQEALRRFRSNSKEPDMPVFKMTLADCYYHLGKTDDAEPLLQECINFWTNTDLPNHPCAAIAYMDLAEIYRSKKEYKEAAEAFKNGEQFKEDELGSANADLPRYLLNLAWLYEKAGEYAEAEPLYKKAWTISEKAHGPRNPEISIILNRYADLLWKSNRWLESTIFKIRALFMRG